MKHQALFSSKDKSKKNKSVVCCNFAWRFKELSKEATHSQHKSNALLLRNNGDACDPIELLSNDVTAGQRAVKVCILHNYVCRHFYKGDNFSDFLFTFLDHETLLKRIFSKMKEFAPRRAISFI